MSNLSFGLTNFFSFITEKNTYNVSIVVDVQEQCNMLINIPKNFVDMCTKVSSELKFLCSSSDKIQNIVATNFNFCDYQIALNSSPLKLKIIKIKDNSYCSYLVANIQILIKFIVFSFLIFYLLCYLGLLRLFSGASKIYYKKYMFKSA